MIVNDKNSQHAATRLVYFGVSLGNRTVIVVPCPGPPLTGSLPPIQGARSLIPIGPNDCVSRILSSAIPLPLAVTARSSDPASSREETLTAVGSAWRATSASA